MAYLEDEVLCDRISAVHRLIPEALDEVVDRFPILLFLLEECPDGYLDIIIKEVAEERACQVILAVDASRLETVVLIEGGPAKGANE